MFFFFRLDSIMFSCCLVLRLSLLLLSFASTVWSHAYLKQPAARASLWKFDPDYTGPSNTDHMGKSCGGTWVSKMIKGVSNTIKPAFKYDFIFVDLYLITFIENEMD